MLKNLSTTYDCKSAGTPSGLAFLEDKYTKKVVKFYQKPHDLLLCHYLTGTGLRVNRLTVNSRFFYSYTSKALELAFPSDAERCFFALRSSLFT